VSHKYRDSSETIFVLGKAQKWGVSPEGLSPTSATQSQGKKRPEMAWLFVRH